jgi:hypothetical protein
LAFLIALVGKKDGTHLAATSSDDVIRSVQLHFDDVAPG